MIRTAATYEDLAQSIIHDLENLDRHSTEYADAMETLSALNSVREAGAAYLALPGRKTYVASNTRAIAAFSTQIDAVKWLRGLDRPPYGGFALVAVDRTGPVDVYTAHETELASA